MSTTPHMAVMMAVMAAKALTQTHDGGASRGGGFFSEESRLRRHGDGGDDEERECRPGPGGGAMTLDE
jgi:hypothetical protein